MTDAWRSALGAGAFGLVLGWLAVLRGRADPAGVAYRAALLGGGAGVAWWLGGSTGVAAAAGGLLAGAWLHGGLLSTLAAGRPGEQRQ